MAKKASLKAKENGNYFVTSLANFLFLFHPNWPLWSRFRATCASFFHQTQWSPSSFRGWGRCHLVLVHFLMLSLFCVHKLNDFRPVVKLFDLLYPEKEVYSWSCCCCCCCCWLWLWAVVIFKDRHRSDDHAKQITDTPLGSNHVLVLVAFWQVDATYFW